MFNIEAKRLYDLNYYRINADRKREYRKKHYKLNATKLRERRKEYYQLNKENEREKRKAYYKLNRIAELEYCKKYNRINKTKRNGYNRGYHQLHKEEISKRHNINLQTERGKLSNRIRSHNRRSLNKGLTLGKVQKVYEENIYKYGTLTCELCFKSIKFGEDSLEHFIPLVRGGTNERDNLGVAHRKCNSLKWKRTLEEFIKIKNGIIMGKDLT